MTHAIKINIHDTHIGIWTNDAPQHFEALKTHLSARGWHVGVDREIWKRYRSLHHTHKAARKGNLLGRLECSPAVLQLDCWAETWKAENRNGHKHDFNKRQRLDYLDRLRLDLEHAKIIAWARSITDDVEIDDHNRRGPARFPDRSAHAVMRDNWVRSGHAVKGLNRTICWLSYNTTSIDRRQINTGDTVWFYDHKGRVGRGRAFYSLNSGWMIKVNSWHVERVFSSDISVGRPADLRAKRNQRARRARLERELESAVASMWFTRAELIKRILFGSEDLYLIFNTEKDAYYRANSSGYTADRMSAGKYTGREAAREVSGIDQLHACTLDGRRVDLTHLLQPREAAAA